MRYWNHLALSVVLLSCFTTSALGTSLDSLSIADAVVLALRNNQNVKIAQLQRVVDDFDLKVAQDKFNPDVDLLASAQYNVWSLDIDESSYDLRDEETGISSDLRIRQLLPWGTGILLSPARYDSWHNRTNSPNQKNESTRWRAAINQPLLKGFGKAVNMASVRLAELDEAGRVLDLKDSITETVNSTIASFRTYATRIQATEVARDGVNRSRAMLGQTRSLIASGNIPDSDIIQAQADLAAREFTLAVRIDAEERARLELLKVLTLPRETRITPGADLAGPEEQPELDACLVLASENRSDFLRSKIAENEAAQELVLARDNAKWRLDVGAEGGYQTEYSDREYDRDIESWSVYTRLQIPIYGELTREQREITAETEVKQTKLASSKQLHDLQIEVSDAVHQVYSTFEQLRMAQTAMSLAEQQLGVEQQKLSGRSGSVFQVISFQNQLVDAQEKELIARQGYLQSLTDLDTAMGTTLEAWQIDYNTAYNEWPGEAR